MKAELNFSVEDLVKSTIEATLVGALEAQGGQVVKEIINHALNEPNEKYSRETVLQASLKKAIQKITLNMLGAWVEANKEKIEAMVAMQCTATLNPNFVASCVVEKLQCWSPTITPFRKKSSDELPEEEEG